jgi:hypothetical protein
MASTFSGVIESFIKPEALKEFDTLGSKIDASLKGFDAVIAKAAMLSTEIQKGGAAYSQYIAASTKIADVNKQLQTTQGSVNTNLSAYNKLLTETANTIKDNTGATDDQARRIIALRTELSKTKDAVEVYQKLIREVNKENPASLSDKTFNQVFDAFGSDTANSIKQAFDNLDSSTKPDFIQQLTTDAAQFLEIQKQLEQELKDTAIAFRLQTKEIVAGEGSIDQLGARLENLQKAYRALNEEERNGSVGVDLKKQIDELDPVVKQLEKSIGITRRLVGDYANQVSQGLSPAFAILNDQLQENNKLMQDAAKFSSLSADAQAQLVTETEALNVLLQKSVASIGDLKTQNTALQKTLLALEAANLKGSESYKIIQAELIKGTKAVNDLRGEVRALQSDTYALDQVIGVASSLVAVYQTGAAAMQLFGEESEDTQKAIAKLVAVQSVLNGLQTIQAQLTKDGTVLNKLYAYSQAQIKIAMDATATSGARLRAVFVTLGIGAIIVGIGLLVNKMIELSSATKKTSVEFDALNDGSVQEAAKTIESLRTNIELAKEGLLSKKDVVNEYNESIGKTTGTVKSLDEAEKELTENGEAYIKMMFLKAAANLALEQAIKKGLEAEITRRKEAQEFVNFSDRAVSTPIPEPGKRTPDQSEFQKKFIEQQGKKRREAVAKEQDKDKDQLLKIFNDFQKQAAEIAKQYNFNFFDPNGGKTGDKKLSDVAERDARAALEIQKRFLQSIKEEQQKIADNQFINPEDRIAALEKINSIEKSFLVADYNLKVQFGKLTAKELENIEDELLKNKTKLNEDSDAKRLAVLKQYTERFKALLTEASAVDIATDKSLNDQFGYEKQINDLLSAFNKRKTIIETNAAKELTQLENARAEGVITEERYNLRRVQIEEETAYKILEAEIKLAKDKLVILKASGVDTLQAEKEIADLELKAAEQRSKALQQSDNKKSGNEKTPTQQEIEDVKELTSAWFEFGQTLKDTVFAVLTRGFEQAKNDIQDQIDLIEDRKAKEIEAVNATQGTIIDKANRIKVIEATAQAQREQLERRQRQIDMERAKFERASQVASIIGNTAQGVTAALTSKPPNAQLAKIVAGIGALQLLTLLATPLPKYLTGKKDNYEGMAHVSEDGRSELYIDRKRGVVGLTPNKPSLMHVTAESEIIPHGKIKDFMNYSGIGHVPQLQSSSAAGMQAFTDMNIVNAIKSKKMQQVVVIHNNIGWQQYVQKHVFN